MRNLVIVFGDQLDGSSAAFDSFDPTLDAILQMEVREEATYIPQNKRRLAFFFAAMRHFRDEQREAGRTVCYSDLEDVNNTGSFSGEIARWHKQLKPEKMIAVQPGDWRVLKALRALKLPLEIRPDRHFLCDAETFSDFADQRGHLILETFYRFMRRRLNILMNDDGTPLGGQWNFDHDNRETLKPKQKIIIPPPTRFPPDEVTQAVLAMVERVFPNNPGSLANFYLPVCKADALAALDDFVKNRLPNFGRYQDAMRGGEWLLFHSALSGPLNLHFLDPREVIAAVIENPKKAPLNSMEGFIRQIIGWREFVRGMYWRLMPDYVDKNELEAVLPMPAFYWTGDTDMRCLQQAIGHTINNAYAHHIERLMVLGLFSLLLGVRPYDVHRWHMSMFWDAIDWVSLPNTLGMSQYGDGGIMGTKPYIASGNYINRMSDHCRNCRYDPGKAIGEDACPFTTLYWDFLERHQSRFQKNIRMKNQYVNLSRKTSEERKQIEIHADHLKKLYSADTFL